MKDIPIPDSIRELFDSYRADSDLNLPEMQPLLAWLNESPNHRAALSESVDGDSRMAQILREVSLPPGISERIRLAMSDADSLGTVPPSGMVDEIDWSEPARQANNLHGPPRVGGVRRKSPARPRSAWIAWGAGLAALGAVICLLLVRGSFREEHPQNPPAYELCRASLGWIQMAENSPWPAESDPRAVDRDFIPKQVFRKQMQTDFGPTECYLTKMGNGRRVYQFSFRSERALGLPTKLPGRPDLPWQGFSCAAYQQGDRVFVVAVEGSDSQYRQAIQSGLPIS